MAISKVEFSGRTLMDLTEDTVSEENLLEGETAHNAKGEKVFGGVIVPRKLSELENDVGYAKSESPEFTGIPKAPNPAPDTNNTQIATTAYVKTLISNLVNGAPETLDTLKEIADALGENDDVIRALNSAIGEKLNKAGDASDTTAAFTQAATRENIASGNKLSVIFGKIMKWFADLKTVAFSGSYTDLSDKPTALKNPSALTFTGAVTGSYDGSAAKSVAIPSVGNATVTIKQNGTVKSTFTLNQSGNVTVELTDNNTWKANTAASEGYVAKGSGQANKVWKTDGNGNPGWRDDANSWRGIQNNLTSTATDQSLSAAQGKALKGMIDEINTGLDGMLSPIVIVFKDYDIRPTVSNSVVDLNYDISDLILPGYVMSQIVDVKVLYTDSLRYQQVTITNLSSQSATAKIMCLNTVPFKIRIYALIYRKSAMAN